MRLIKAVLGMGILFLLVFILGGCSNTTKSNGATVTFDGNNCKYDGPKSVSAGSMTITFINTSDKDASISIAKLEEGKTWQDYLDYIGPPGSESEYPKWTNPSILKSPVQDNPDALIYQLEEGTYAIACCTCNELFPPRGVWPGVALEVKN